MSRRARWSLIVVGVLGVAAVAVWFLLLSPFPPGPDVPVGYDRCERLCISRSEEALEVVPPDGATTGLVFYTGARVPPTAYLELAAGVALDGHLVVVPQLPLNYAVFDQDAAAEVIADHPEVTAWAVGGHSLGGAMAARFAADGPVDGLALLAAWPEGGLDLTGSGLEVVVVYGTADEIATPAEVQDGLDRLPSDTEVVPIEGGNHAGFGDYGPQRGDGEATIDPVTQTRRSAEAIAGMMERVRP